MINRFGKTAMLTAAAAIAVVALAGAAGAATAPVSDPHIVAHFNLGAGQTPEDFALAPDGAVDVSFAYADEVAQVTRGGNTQILGQLPKTGGCPVIKAPVSLGIARARDGAVYAVDCTGNADTGVWRLRPGSVPAQIAQLPADSFPHKMALDDQTRELYVADSLLGVVWQIPAAGGTPVIWARGPALQRISLFGANGITLHDHAVWVSNTDQGTIVEIPIRANGSAGPIRTVVTGLTGEVDDFTVLGGDDSILAALNPSTQVVLIRPGGQPQVVLTAEDGLSNPTDIAVRGDSIYVTNGAYFTRNDPNLLVARLDS
jgi:sugar lactone lactonase YvrE